MIITVFACFLADALDWWTAHWVLSKHLRPSNQQLRVKGQTPPTSLAWQERTFRHLCCCRCPSLITDTPPTLASYNLTVHAIQRHLIWSRRVSWRIHQSSRSRESQLSHCESLGYTERWGEQYCGSAAGQSHSYLLPPRAHWRCKVAHILRWTGDKKIPPHVANQYYFLYFHEHSVKGYYHIIYLSVKVTNYLEWNDTDFLLVAGSVLLLPLSPPPPPFFSALFVCTRFTPLMLCFGVPPTLAPNCPSPNSSVASFMAGVIRLLK